MIYIKQDLIKIVGLSSKIDPKVVGITATTATVKNALNYVNTIKKVLPNALTVIGDSHPTFMPTKTLKAEESLDVVVVGEEDKTIVEISEEYEKNLKSFSEINGMVYIANNKINITPPRHLIKNLDDLPFLQGILYRSKLIQSQKIRQEE